jgi:hypothetical protein
VNLEKSWACYHRLPDWGAFRHIPQKRLQMNLLLTVSAKLGGAAEIQTNRLHDFAAQDAPDEICNT